jgi:hypothetical protein
LIKLGGRADIEGLKKKSEKFYNDSDQYEAALDDVALKVKDKGKLFFKLDESKHLKWFDPFYFLKPNQYA